MTLDEGVLLYDGAVLQHLPGAAALIWQEIDGVCTCGELADRLAARFGDAAPTVHADVLEFLDVLGKRGVVNVLRRAPHPAYALSRSVGFVRDGPVVLLVDLRDGRRRALPPAGARIWDLVTEFRSAIRIADELKKDYPHAPPSLADDVSRHLDELVREGFLVRSQ